MMWTCALQFFPSTRYLDYAVQVEEYTLTKSANLVMTYIKPHAPGMPVSIPSLLAWGRESWAILEQSGTMTCRLAALAYSLLLALGDPASMSV
jgi:hypothetical protein